MVKGCDTWNLSKIREKSFFSFDLFLICEVFIHRQRLTLMDRNGGSDFLDCWNSGTKGCLNIKNLIWEQVFDGGMAFHLVIWLKSRAGQKDPPPGDNVIPEPRWNRVKKSYIDTYSFDCATTEIMDQLLRWQFCLKS